MLTLDEWLICHQLVLCTVSTWHTCSWIRVGPKISSHTLNVICLPHKNATLLTTTTERLETEHIRDLASTKKQNISFHFSQIYVSKEKNK